MTDGCVDFALSADLIDPGRIDVFEQWRTETALVRFRGCGPSDDQNEAIRCADVREFHLNG